MFLTNWCYVEYGYDTQATKQYVVMFNLLIKVYSYNTIKINNTKFMMTLKVLAITLDTENTQL